MRIPIPFAAAAILGTAISGLATAQESDIKLEDPDALKGDLDKVRLEDDGPQVSLPGGTGTTPLPEEAIDLNAILNDAAAAEKPVLEKLTQEERQRLARLLAEAGSYISGIRIQEAFERLFEAVDIAPDLFSVHNLMGAAYTKMRDFKKARVSFGKAVEIAPRAFMARFNLTEIDFVEGQFAEALKGFGPLVQKLEEEIATLMKIVNDPRRPLNDKERKGLRMRIDATQSTVKLIKFKILICHLKLADKEAADKIQGEFHFLDDTPGFYYGNASKEFQLADLAKANDDEKAERKHTEEAQGWLRSAEKIYDRPQLEIYTDSLIEVGWIENLQ